MLIRPMSPDDVPAYLSKFADWYVQSLADAAQRVDDADARVHEFVAPQLGPDGMPVGSMIFDIHCEELGADVGALWAGGADFGFGPLCYVHDLRVYPPYRRRGFAREALEFLYERGKEQGGSCGVALSVMTSNAIARELYASSGFSALSEVMVRRF